MTSKTKEPAPQQPKANSGRTIAEFRASHDTSFIVPTKIKAALASMSGGWLYEGEFVKLAGISLTQLGVYREQFQEHVVVLKGTQHGGRRAWAATKALAKQMQEMVA
jgi:hypothetical protein